MTKQPNSQQQDSEPAKIIGGDPQLRSRLNKEWEDAQQPMRYRTLDWDLYEDLLFVRGNSPDEVSEGSLSSIVTERATRVANQMPSGVVEALSIKDQGKSLLMDLVLHNYVLPNAGDGYDIETLLWMWDLYSNVYGAMPMVYDWKSTEAYTGPYCFLCPIRNYFPQQGRIDPKLCEFVFIASDTDRSGLQQIIDEKDDNWDLEAIQRILDQSKDKAVKPSSTDNYLRNNPMMQQRRRSTYTNTGQIELITKYESGKDGHWITFAPDYGSIILRDIPNPHQNGKIPVIVKQAMPLIDDPVGLGDMERGAKIQMGMDATLNLQLDGQKLRTYPPLKIITDNVQLPSIRLQPAAKWFVSGPNDVSEHQMAPPEQHVNQTYTFLKGAINNVLGNTSTQASGDSDQVQPGKSPKAIQQQNESQSTRDTLDRKLHEQAVEELYQGFIDLINTKQEDPIEVYMFGDEIQQIIQQGYEDVKELVRFKGAKDGADIKEAKSVFVSIGPNKLQNEKGFRYRIDAGSSMVEDNEEQHKQLTEIMTTYIGNPMAVESLLNAGGWTIDFPDMFKQWLITGGMRKWNQVLKPMAHGSAQGQMGATNQGGQQPAASAKGPSESMNFKDIPPDAQAAMLQQANLPGDMAMQQAQPVQAPMQGQVPPEMAGQPGAPQPSAAYQAQPGMPQISDPHIAAAHEHVMRHALTGAAQ